jgi:hypothetical protein
MATYVPAKRATELIFYMGLVSQSTGQFQANPTLAAGDVKVSKDGGALANLTTLPTVTPAAGKMVKVTLSAPEMTADNVTVVFSDAAGAEWDDCIINIQTAANQIDDIIADTNDIQTRIPAALSGDGFMKADMLSINDELTSGNNATLNLKRISILNPNSEAVSVISIATGGYAGMYVYGNDYGLQVQSAVGPGISAEATSGNQPGAQFVGSGTGKSVQAEQDIALPSGDLDDQLQALPTAAENATATWASGTRTLTSFGTLVADIWATAIETGYTAKQSMRLMLSALAGKLSGAATTTVTIRDAADSKDRIVATVDSDGNRTAVTHDTTD